MTNDILKISKLFKYVHRMTEFDFQKRIEKGEIRLVDLLDCAEIACHDGGFQLGGLGEYLNAEQIQKEQEAAENYEFAEACARAQEQAGQLEAAKAIRDSIKSMR